MSTNISAFLVIPAKAGIQIENFCFSSLPESCAPQTRRGWIPAFAGMTIMGGIQ